MSSSRLGVAIDALVARATAVAGSQAAIVDGSTVTNDPLQKVIVIGWDGSTPENGGDYSATSEWVQEWAGLGQQRKDETFGINCCVACWTGDVGAKARRDDALALLALLENDLRTDPSLGVAPQPFVALLSAGQLFQEPGPYGTQARITFTVAITHNRI